MVGVCFVLSCSLIQVGRPQLHSPGNGSGGIVDFVVAGLALVLYWSTFFCPVSPSAVVESVSRVLG